MNKAQRARLEKSGWKIGTVAEFLGLTPEESEMIELKLTLAATVREQRTARKVTQVALAKKLNSSQSRVAKIEAGDPSVSTDLLFRSLFALGTKRRQIASAISASKPRRRTGRGVA